MEEPRQLGSRACALTHSSLGRGRDSADASLCYLLSLFGCMQQKSNSNSLKFKKDEIVVRL